MTIRDIIVSFLKIGTIGFGGGSALIPITEKELVAGKKWCSDDRFNTATIIANITPGALPVKLGALWNERYSVISAYSVTLPGVFMMIMLLTAFSFIDQSSVKYIEYASIGISAVIILILYQYIKKVMDEGRHAMIGLKYILIMVVGFLLTGGREIREVFASVSGFEYLAHTVPLFDISALNLMIISFFCIIFLGNINILSSGTGFKLGVFICSILSIGFAVASGKSGLLNGFSIWIAIIMLLFVVGSFFLVAKNKGATRESKRALNDSQNGPPLGVIKSIGLFILLPALLIALYLAITWNDSCLKYLTYASISTAVSFGGGEAYVSVADGFFVQEGLIEGKTYYSQIVAVANALPGPILVKIVSAIGYIIGVNEGGFYYGWLLSLVGFSVSVGVSSIGALLVYMCFDRLKENPILMLIKRYILPVVCGLLISTILSMAYECLKIFTGSLEVMGCWGFVTLLAMFFVALFLHRRFHVNDLMLILLFGGFSLLSMSVLA